jgi:hypothetical protein
MPQVTIRTGFIGADEREEILSEYLCDSPDCPNYASHVVGFARELGVAVAVCAEHAVLLGHKPRDERK